MSQADHVALKGLQTTREKLSGEITVARKEQDRLQKRVNELRRDLTATEKKIQTLTERNAKVVISEHALLRYFERVLGFDIESIKQTLLPEQVEQQVKVLGGGVYPVDNKFKVRIRGNTVLTVLTEEG